MKRIPAIRGSALKALSGKTKLQLQGEVIAPVVKEPVKVKADKPKKSKVVKKSSVKKNASVKKTV